MQPRDAVSRAITSNVGALHDAPASSHIEQTQLDIRRPSTHLDNAPLLVIGLAYPILNVLVLYFVVGAMVLLNMTNFYCFSFGLPILTAVGTCLLRLKNVFRFSWLAFDSFLAWMSLIGYCNMQLFFIAWASV